MHSVIHVTLSPKKGLKIGKTISKLIQYLFSNVLCILHVVELTTQENTRKKQHIFIWPSIISCWINRFLLNLHIHDTNILQIYQNILSKHLNIKKFTVRLKLPKGIYCFMLSFMDKRRNSRHVLKKVSFMQIHVSEQHSKIKVKWIQRVICVSPLDTNKSYVKRNGMKKKIIKWVKYRSSSIINHLKVISIRVISHL